MQHAFPGDRLKISAEDWNRVRRVADNGSTGVTSNRKGPYCEMALAYTGAAGISPRVSGTLGSGTITFYGIATGGVATATTETATAYNISQSAVAGNAYIIVAKESRTFQWIVIAEDCGAGGS